MFKKFAMAVVPALLFAVNAFASDDLSSVVANFESAKSGANELKVDVAKEDALGKADVDALLGEKAVDEKDAIAACFRGGRGRGSYGHSHHGSYGCYSSSYSSCYYPNYCCYDTWYPTTTCSYYPTYCTSYTPTYYTSYTPTYCTTYTPTTYCTGYTPTYCTSYTPSWNSSCCTDWGWQSHCR